MSADKRRETRYSVTVDARIRNGTGVARQVVVADLSRRGCRMISPHRRLGPDSFLTITVARVGFLDARVKWRDGDVHGILFDHPLHSAVLDHIRYYLSREAAYLDDSADPMRWDLRLAG